MDPARPARSNSDHRHAARRSTRRARFRRGLDDQEQLGPATDSHPLSPAALQRLQNTHGNDHVQRLIQARHAQPSLQRQTAVAPTGGAVPPQAHTPADIAIQDVFNPMDKVHKLVNAIDASDVKLHPAESKPGMFGQMWIKKRHIDYNAVVGVLTGLTKPQADILQKAYYDHEKRTLTKDLFEGGHSGYESDLKPDQRHRLAALMGGTVVHREATEADKREIGAANLRADAAELHELLHGDLKKENVERVMRLLRKSPNDNLTMAAAYMGLFLGGSLGGDLGRLPFTQVPRAILHYQGQHAQADRAAVGNQQSRIAGIDEELAKVRTQRAKAAEDDDLFAQMKVRELDEKIKKLETERRGLAHEIEERLGGVMEASREAALNQGADRATAERMARAQGHELLGGEKGVAAIGGLDAVALRAMLADDPVTKVGADILRAHADGKLKAETINAALRSLRQEAEKRVQAENPGADASTLEGKSRARTDEYYARLKTTYQQYMPLWSFDTLVAETGDKEDAAVNQQLMANQGKLSDVEELVAALSNGRKDLDTVERILKPKSALEIAVLKAQYYGRTLRSLDYDLFGADTTTAEGKKLDWMRLSARPQDAGKATGEARLRLEDYVQRPAEEGGLAEVMYLSNRAEREYKYAIDNRGFTGWMRDTWGNEQRELLDETIGVVRQQYNSYFYRAITNPAFAKTKEAHEILHTMRLARATIRGDRAEYEKATAALRSLLQSIAAFAIQIALSAVLGPIAAAAGRLIQAAATVVRVAVRAAISVASNTVASVGSNLIAYGSDYSLAMLKSDILGGVGGPIGSGAVGRLSKVAGGYLGKKLAGKVSNEMLQLGKMVAGEAVELGKTAGGMKTGAWAQGEDVELSLTEILKARGMDLVQSKATDKLSKAAGFDEKAPPPPELEGVSKLTEPKAGGAPGVVAGDSTATPTKPPQSDGVPQHIGPEGDAPLRPDVSTGVPEHIPTGKTAPSHADTQPVPAKKGGDIGHADTQPVKQGDIGHADTQPVAAPTKPADAGHADTQPVAVPKPGEGKPSTGVPEHIGPEGDAPLAPGISTGVPEHMPTGKTGPGHADTEPHPVKKGGDIGHEDTQPVPEGKRVLAEAPVPGTQHVVKVDESGACLICSNCAYLRKAFETELNDPANHALKAALETAESAPNPAVKATMEAKLAAQLLEASQNRRSADVRSERGRTTPKTQAEGDAIFHAEREGRLDGRLARRRSNPAEPDLDYVLYDPTDPRAPPRYADVKMPEPTPHRTLEQQAQDIATKIKDVYRKDAAQNVTVVVDLDHLRLPGDKATFMNELSKQGINPTDKDVVILNQ